MDFFPLYFCFARRAKFSKNFCIYQVRDAETLQSECTAWPNPFQNLNSKCKKVPLSSPPSPPPPPQRLHLCSPPPTEPLHMNTTTPPLEQNNPPPQPEHPRLKTPPTWIHITPPPSWTHISPAYLNPHTPPLPPTWTRIPPIWTHNNFCVLAPDTFLECNSLIFVPTFDTKVTEYLCPGWFFFSSDKFRLFN